MLLMVMSPQLVTTAVTRLGWPTMTESQVLVTPRHAIPSPAWMFAGDAIQHANDKLARTSAQLWPLRNIAFRFFMGTPSVVDKNLLFARKKLLPAVARLW